ncbi:MAG: DNA topoisomerase I, partial [Nanoarchaeota archaeon]|nr:DNA topoisomerase I [Nanoarchaeota archaeon]
IPVSFRVKSMSELIITEKPSTAEKIAKILADKSPKIHKVEKIKYYELEHKGKKIFVACAVGHLFGLAEKNKHGWTYPVFEVEWKPAYEVNKFSQYTKPYITLLKKLAKESKEFTIATDFDIEGEVIGYNILRYICNKEDAKRMKYSTTTDEELLESYEKAWKHIDSLQAEAGVTRHTLDFYYGINVSRALTLAIKNATGMFKILSSGRVQGPALKILARREEKIKKFIPEPFWRIEAITEKFGAWHVEDKFLDKKKADDVVKKTKGKDALIEDIDKREFKQLPPNPFDLTALQIEAHKVLGMAPKETMQLAQKLYVNSYISYPRTSSNQYPTALNYEKMLKNLSKNPHYKKLCDELLKKKELIPNNGKKTDAAHPAIYCTGVVPKKLGAREAKIYDLIARRMLATFSELATRETVTIILDINKEKFHVKGTRTIEPGWHTFYGPYLRLEEVELPKLEKGQELKVKEIKRHDLETQPPKRYTAASIIKKLESLNLGTKATRSEIIDHLFQRNYVRDKSIEVTDLGMITIKTLKKYCPEIIDEELTGEFEKDMEDIREKKKKGKEILEEAKKFLTTVLEKFKKNEKAIGKALGEATKKTRDEESIVGKCKKCGSNLRILYSKRFKSRFVACSGYPNCKTTFSLPQGIPKPSDKFCEECGFPLVMIIRAGKRPFFYCINKECPAKERWRQEQAKLKEAEAKTKELVKKTVKKVVKKTIKKVVKKAKKK